MDEAARISAKRSPPAGLIVFTGIVVAVLGLAMFVLGGWLAFLGGSYYYAVAGAALLVSGILLSVGRRSGPWLYLITLAATTLWALSEVGLDGWALIPRVVMLAVVGLWIASPWVLGRLERTAGTAVRAARARAFGGMCACLGVLLLAFVSGYSVTASRYVMHGASRISPDDAATASDSSGVPAEDWPYYGRTPAGQRFSPLDQINSQNVAHLTQAWSFSTGDLPRSGENARGREFSFEATPIKVGSTLYFCTPHREVIALDATSGALRWRFDPGGDMSHNIYQACRGVSYYAAPPGVPCPHRIISTASDLPRLFAIDADTGELCQSFGERGMVDLREHMGPVPPGFHFITSPPMVMNDRVVLSGWVYDNQSEGEPSGVIRAFDPVSGKLAWAWDLGRAQPTAPLGQDDTYTRGTPNGWGVYTADPALNLVYVPLGNATPDYYGANRRSFDDEYNSAIVALDLSTGEERWHFQTVHHDLWDYDLPIGPTLIDLPGPHGATTPALLQTTKQGELFLLDRRDGHPLSPVTERPVPQGDVPGERYSATQPYSEGMPNLRQPDLTETDMWGATPIDQLMCRIGFRRAHYRGLYTPPGLYTTLGYPAFDGVMDWYGATIDPQRQLAFVNLTFIPFTFEMLPQQVAIKRGLIQPWAGWGHPYPQPKFQYSPQHGTPYAIVVKPWLNVLGVPCNAPPWGRMEAIDLTTHAVIWQRPVGTTRDMGPLGIRLPLGLPVGAFSIGGGIATRSGLIFIAATSDQYFRALDERDGKILWQTHLPAGGNATPLSYMGSDGRQFVVIAAGGHGGLHTRNGDQVIAYALPSAPPTGSAPAASQ